MDSTLETVKGAWAMSSDLESSRHLYQPPLYKGGSVWTQDLQEALCGAGRRLTWDVGAVLGIISFSYPCGDRTLVHEVTRRPWLSKVGGDRQAILEEIPSHGLLWDQVPRIARRLYELLQEEAAEVCAGRRDVYVLLSGGLDSRIVAGTVGELKRQGRIEGDIIAVTWGLDDSRDAVYAQKVAEKLGFEWKHLDLRPEHVLENIEWSATLLGGWAPAHHLHRMAWFRRLSDSSIVLSGSYGDSVGRAEYSGRHVLTLDYLQPQDWFQVLQPLARKRGQELIDGDLRRLRERSGGVSQYVQCEHEMEGHYMRNMLGHMMTLMNASTRIYQMYTHPKVYGYMWSIHPALRDDGVYAELLDLLPGEIGSLPWARTNRALRGATQGRQSGLRANFHLYDGWVKNELYRDIELLVDPQWFEWTGIFRPERIEWVRRTVAGGGALTVRMLDLWLWLATFRRYAEWLERSGFDVESFSSQELHRPIILPRKTKRVVETIKVVFGRSAAITGPVKWIRNRHRKALAARARRASIQRYPPQVQAVNDEDEGNNR